jgi:HEAT repeats
MPRLAFKPDSSFFEKIVRGAIGTLAVCHDLDQHGHQMVELERGALDTKLWKDVKRKRVRIPDLLCLKCGLRVESRAKAKAELTMSHSTGDAERVWDFGMVDADCVAFPVCESTRRMFWSHGKLHDAASYWHERDWTHWALLGRINYFRVSEFRAVPFQKKAMKGVTEGSETVIEWPATFSTRIGHVESIQGQKVAIRRTSDRHNYTWTIRPNQSVFVTPGEKIEEHQVIASAVKPVGQSELNCPGNLPRGHIVNLLQSRERTQRFTGVKLARLLRDDTHTPVVAQLTQDTEEDVYIRLEGMAYLASVGGYAIRELFSGPLNSPDQQTQLEAVIAIGETATPGAVELLSEILDRREQPYFLRSAAAWCLGQIGGQVAITKLVHLFRDVDVKIREEALDRIVVIGREAFPALSKHIGDSDADLAAGCAEALRQQHLSEEMLRQLAPKLQDEAPLPVWPVWLFGNLPRQQAAPIIAELQKTAPQLHYAVSLLWSFTESWIAQRWELNPGKNANKTEDMIDV